MRRAGEASVERGNALLGEGDVGGAVRCYEDAIAADPGYARAHFNLGVALQRLDRADEALRHYERAVESEPHFARAWVNLGTLLLRRGDPHRAAAMYQRAVEIDATDGHALNNLAGIELERGELAKARLLYERALENGSLEAHTGLGKVALREGDAAGAVEHFRRAILHEAGKAAAHHGLGLALAALDRHAEALENYEQAMKGVPMPRGLQAHAGDSLANLGRFEEAAEFYRRALTAEPGNPHALSGLAAASLRAGDVRGAQILFSRAADADGTKFQSARFNAALMALISQDFAAGWDDYELRFEFPPWRGTLTHCPLPRLDGENIADARRVAVLKEQGVGDQILFSTLLPELAARGLQAVVEIDPRLLSALARSLPGVEFVTTARASAAFLGCDHQAPLASLARIFRHDIAAFEPQPEALLQADPARTGPMRKRASCDARIAIAWRSFRERLGDSKSFPLARFGVFEGSGVELLDVQYGDVAQERRAFDASHPGLRSQVEGLDLFNDLEGVLAALDSSDLVVTGSNVTAHLAGAIGKRTWLVYLNGVPPFHYWTPGADGRSLWYPSVEIMTDRSWSSWEQAFDAVAARWRAERPS